MLSEVPFRYCDTVFQDSETTLFQGHRMSVSYRQNRLTGASSPFFRAITKIFFKTRVYTPLVFLHWVEANFINRFKSQSRNGGGIIPKDETYHTDENEIAAHEPCQQPATKTATSSGMDIPDYQYESIARCLLPKIRAYYESEEGQQAFAEWQKRKSQK